MSAIAPPAPGKPSTRTPSSSARLSVGRNGAPEGIVKTRGSRGGMRAFYAGRAGRQATRILAPKMEPQRLAFSPTVLVLRSAEGASRRTRTVGGLAVTPDLLVAFRAPPRAVATPPLRLECQTAADRAR